MVKINAKTKVKREMISVPKDVAHRHSVFEEEPGGTDKKNPDLSLKYYDYNYQCFSEFSPEDLRQFTDVCRKFSQMNWGDIKKQGGKKGNKTGLAPTLIERHQLPKSRMLEKISDDIDFMELRLSKKARIFGFRSSSTFFLVFLDNKHEIC